MRLPASSLAASRIQTLAAHLAAPTSTASTPSRHQSTTTTANMASTTTFPPPPPLGESQAGHVPDQGPAKIHLWTAGTPNGYKVSVLLEELRDAYPEAAKNELSYDVSKISIWENQQKHPDFLKINPNGRIPAIIDDNVTSVKGGFPVWESASIELWLVEQYDKENKLWFADPLLRAQALNWIFFAHGGVGPMQGQTHVFFRYAPIKIPFAIKRYHEETKRLYSVLEDGLKAGAGKWLVGDKYSVADINVFGWVRSAVWAGIDLADFPLLSAWADRIEKRPAVQRGISVPDAPKDLSSIKDESVKDVNAWVDKANAELEEIKKQKEATA